MQVYCWGGLPRKPLQELVQSTLQSRPSGVRTLPSLTGRGICWVVFPVILACPKLTHMVRESPWLVQVWRRQSREGRGYALAGPVLFSTS